MSLRPPHTKDITPPPSSGASTRLDGLFSLEALQKALVSGIPVASDATPVDAPPTVPRASVPPLDKAAIAPLRVEFAAPIVAPFGVAPREVADIGVTGPSGIKKLQPDKQRKAEREAAAAVVAAQKAKEKAEREAAAAVVAAQKAEEKAEREAEREAAAAVVAYADFLDVFPNGEADYDLFKADLAARAILRATYKGRSKVEWQLDHGNRLAAEDKLRKNLESTAAFTNWESTKSQNVTQLIEFELGLLSKLITRVQKAHARAALDGKLADAGADALLLPRMYAKRSALNKQSFKAKYPTATPEDFDKEVLKLQQREEEKEKFLVAHANNKWLYDMQLGLLYEKRDKKRGVWLDEGSERLFADWLESDAAKSVALGLAEYKALQGLIIKRLKQLENKKTNSADATADAPADAMEDVGPPEQEQLLVVQELLEKLIEDRTATGALPDAEYRSSFGAAATDDAWPYWKAKLDKWEAHRHAFFVTDTGDDGGPSEKLYDVMHGREQEREKRLLMKWLKDGRDERPMRKLTDWNDAVRDREMAKDNPNPNWSAIRRKLNVEMDTATDDLMSEGEGPKDPTKLADLRERIRGLTQAVAYAHAKAEAAAARKAFFIKYPKAEPSDFETEVLKLQHREDEKTRFLASEGSSEALYNMNHGLLYEKLDRRRALWLKADPERSFADWPESDDRESVAIGEPEYQALRKELHTSLSSLEGTKGGVMENDAETLKLKQLQTVIKMLDDRIALAQEAKAADAAATAARKEAGAAARKEAKAAEVAARQEAKAADAAAAAALKQAEVAARQEAKAAEVAARQEAKAADAAAAAALKEAKAAEVAKRKEVTAALKQERAFQHNELLAITAGKLRERSDGASGTAAATAFLQDIAREKAQALFDTKPADYSIKEMEPTQPNHRTAARVSMNAVASTPFTAKQLDYLYWKQSNQSDFLPTPVGGNPPAPSDATTLGEVALTQPLVFNKPYARKLLLQHLESLAEIHRKAKTSDPMAEFTNVAESLGLDRERAVDQLLPFFQSMLDYRNTIIAVKHIQITNERNLIEVAKGRDEKRYNRMTAALNKLKVRQEWQIYAHRVIESDRGQLPGQLYRPQPWFLPLRIAAPPRVGKSATALLVASLAKRLRMVSLYSVSPNKTAPINELLTKLKRIGWGDPYDPTNKGGGIHMEYYAKIVDHVHGCNPDLSKLDMVMYSSDGTEDVQRVGSLLAAWRRTDTIVFHIRDEAQSLAKELKNDVVACHKVEVPPSIVLQYLRFYYGNVYGLNCNVTATHFPTLLEEQMWGFIGSTGQNVRAYLAPSASKATINKQLGSNFLPALVPALTPAIPVGYMGVDRLVQWGILQRGVHTAVNSVSDLFSARADALEMLIEDTSKERAQAEEDEEAQPRAEAAAAVEVAAAETAAGNKVQKPSVEVGAAAAAAAADLGALEIGGLARAGVKRGRGDAGGEKNVINEAPDDAAAPAADADLKCIGDHYTEWARLTPQNISTFRSPENTLKMMKWQLAQLRKSLTEEKALKADIIKHRANDETVARNVDNMELKIQLLHMEIQLAQLRKKGDGGAGPSTASPPHELAGSVAELKEENAEEEWDDGEDAEDSDEEEEALLDEMKPRSGLGATVPLSKINRLERLENKITVSKSRMAAEKLQDYNNLLQGAILVPMYIGALNNTISDTGMASFIRYFGMIQNDMAKEAKQEDATAPNYGVAYLLYTSVIHNTDDLSRSNIKWVPDRNITTTGALPFVADKALGGSALLAIYKPEDNKEIQRGGEPHFRCYRTYDAEQATGYALKTHKITRVAALGYGMLKAGLTMQNRQEHDDFDSPLYYCPQYVAMATSDTAALDDQLQTAGRAFVDLKTLERPLYAPDAWKIQLLGVKDIETTLVQYSAMEMRLAKATARRSERLTGMPVYEVLRSEFGTSFMITNSVNSIGVVGTRRGDFGSILGLTASDAAAAATRAAKNRLAGGVTEEVDHHDEAERDRANKEEAAAVADLQNLQQVVVDGGMDISAQSPGFF